MADWFLDSIAMLVLIAIAAVVVHRAVTTLDEEHWRSIGWTLVVAGIIVAAVWALARLSS